MSDIKNREIFVPAGGPPRTAKLSPEIYKTMGEDNIFKMLEDFYLELEKSSIREMFPEDMKHASQRSAAFFVGILGGPPLYHDRYGPPMMRARHLPFKIDAQAQEVWLNCFYKTLETASEKYLFPKEHLDNFKIFLKDFSGWMVNTK